MTNAEFYLSQEIDKNTLYNKLGQYIDERPKDKACSYITYHKVKNFFESEVQPTLTEDERVILRNIKDVRSIKRDNEGDLVIHRISTGVYYITPFNHLFQFIKERRRIFY